MTPDLKKDGWTAFSPAHPWYWFPDIEFVFIFDGVFLHYDTMYIVWRDNFYNMEETDWEVWYKDKKFIVTCNGDDYVSNPLSAWELAQFMATELNYDYEAEGEETRAIPIDFKEDV